MSTTKSLQPLDVKDWDQSIASIVDDMEGKPLNIHKLMANHPELLRAWWRFRQYVVTGGRLGKRHAELVILRTAFHLGCWYEWASHVDRGLAAEISINEIEDLAEHTMASRWSQEELLLLKAVDELYANNALSKHLLLELEQHFDTRQLMDLISIHSTYLMLGRFLNTWQIEVDDHVAKRLPDTVSEAKFKLKSGSLT